MKTGKKIIIAVIIIVVAIIGVVGYFGYQTMTSSTAEVTNITKVTNITEVETTTIQNEKTEIVLSGQVKTKETKTEYYDYLIYGKLWEAKVGIGQHVNEGDIIVEAGKKDYKAPFNGYIAEINAQAAYDEAKKAYDDKTMLEMPTVLYTIISDDYYLETSLTEYEVNRLPETRTIKYAIRAKDIDTYYDASIRMLSALPTVAQPTGTTTTKTDISTYTLTLNMDSGKEQARVGNHVTIRIRDAAAPALTIPTSAIVKEEGKIFVYLVTADTPTAPVTKKEVKGAEENGKFRVDSGLTTGEVVVTSNVAALTDGKIVQQKVATETTQNA